MQPYLPRPVINYLMCDITYKYIYYTATFLKCADGGKRSDRGLYPLWSWFEVNGTEVYDCQLLNDFYRNCFCCGDFVRTWSDIVLWLGTLNVMCLRQCDHSNICSHCCKTNELIYKPKRILPYFWVSAEKKKTLVLFFLNLVCAPKYVCFLRSQEAHIRVSCVF